ncbi:hypothetical protein AAHH84_00050 [Candidatus Hodgkinia cicadicola]
MDEAVVTWAAFSDGANEANKASWLEPAGLDYKLLDLEVEACDE